MHYVLTIHESSSTLDLFRIAKCARVNFGVAEYVMLYMLIIALVNLSYTITFFQIRDPFKSFGSVMTHLSCAVSVFGESFFDEHYGLLYIST